jgi:hypothetical protein
LPVDVRSGTAYLARAEREGLVEGNFLWRRYRFADPRTALVAQVLGAMPTRLAERSVPIGLHDLGYNLGIARRLRPEIDLDAETSTYFRVATRWNEDQLRLLVAAAEPASHLDRPGVERLIAREQPRVRGLDEGLLAECDAALAAVERAVSRAMHRSVRRHARGRLLSGLAMTMTLAACDRDVLWRTDMGPSPTDDWPDQGVARADMEAPDLGPPDFSATDFAYPRPDLPMIDGPVADGGCAAQSSIDPFAICSCGYSTITIDVTFDDKGMASSVQGSNGAPLSQTLVDCYMAFLSQHCYPSFANTIQAVHPACWIA